MNGKKDVMKMTDSEFEAWRKSASAAEISAALCQELKDPKSPAHKIIPTIKLEVRS